MSKTTNKFSPGVRARAVRMILDHQLDYPSRWSAVVAVADKIGCTPQTLHEWVKRAEVDSGKRAGCVFRKVQDSDSGKSRTVISESPGQAFH